MQRPISFRGLADGRVHELDDRVVAFDHVPLVVRAFSYGVCRGILVVAKWAFVRRGVTVSFSKLAIV